MYTPTKLESQTDELVKGLWRENPIFIQVLGLCPALAVSNTAINSLTMGLATGIFLPLITTNCAIPGLALFQTNRG